VLIKHGSCPRTTSGKTQRHAARAEFLEERLQVVGQWRAKKSATPGATAPAVERKAAQPPSGDAIREWLIAKVADRVGVAPSAIDPGRVFVQLGVGSAEALTLIGELELWLGHKLSPVLVYDYPDIDSLARHLAQTALREQATSESRS
jgi:acyl carrier protein